jgi:hypothetical protein
MKRNLMAFLAMLLAAASAGAQTVSDLQGANPPANGLWVDLLDLSKVDQEWGNPHAGRSVDNLWVPKTSSAGRIRENGLVGGVLGRAGWGRRGRKMCSLQVGNGII